MISLTDEYGNPQVKECEETDLAEKYFGKIIKHLNRKKPAIGTASGLIWPNPDDKRESYSYRPRLTFDVFENIPDGKIDLMLYISYAYMSAGIRYREDDGFHAGYEVLIEKRAIVRDECGLSQTSKLAKMQEDVIDILKSRLRI